MNTALEHTRGNCFLFLLVLGILSLQASILMTHSECAELHDLFEITSQSTVNLAHDACVVSGEGGKEAGD